MAARISLILVRAQSAMSHRHTHYTKELKDDGHLQIRTVKKGTEINVFYDGREYTIVTPIEELICYEPMDVLEILKQLLVEW